MPINVIATEGLFDDRSAAALFKALTDAFLRRHGLLGNAFLTPNVIGEVATVPAGRTFSGGSPGPVVVVELKVPSFALSERGQKELFVAEATALVVQAAGGKLTPSQVWVNMVYAVDGLWGIGGKAYTNAELLDAVRAAAPRPAAG
jgi:phenylpyruvate tautomerase PptA (4-oxalocrotonate tautomerase family)